MRIFLTFLGSLLFSALHAQARNDLFAPDFTVTDLSGTSHQLYPVLEQNKAVIIMVGATWHTDSWQYHNSGVLNTLYQQYGPGGSDKLRIFFVEGDPATGPECLTNLPSCGGTTLGNWQTNTLYPIVDNAPLAQLLGANNLPSLFLICTDHRVRVLTDWSLQGLTNQIELCPAPAQGEHVAVASFVTNYTETSLCGVQHVIPTLRLFNEGTATITHLEVTIYKDNNILQINNLSTTLGSYQMATFSFAPVTVAGATQLKAVVTKVNGMVPASVVAGEQSFQASPVAASNEVTLRIRTDNFAVETYWEITDLAGTVFAKGGNESVGPNGGGMGSVTAGNGTYANNATIVIPLSLPANHCYRLHFVDAFGDGLCSEGGSFRIYETGNTSHILAEGSCNFSDRFAVFGMGNVNETTHGQENTLPFRIWPLPATEQIRVELPDELTNEVIYWALRTIQGAQIRSGQTIRTGGGRLNIPVADLPAGCYVLQLNDSGRFGAAKVIVH